MKYTLTFTKVNTTDPVTLYDLTADNLDQAYLNSLSYLIDPQEPELSKNLLEKCILKIVETREFNYQIAVTTLAHTLGYLIAVFEADLDH